MKPFAILFLLGFLSLTPHVRVLAQAPEKLPQTLTVPPPASPSGARPLGASSRTNLAPPFSRTNIDLLGTNPPAGLRRVLNPASEPAPQDATANVIKPRSAPLGATSTNPPAATLGATPRRAQLPSTLPATAQQAGDSATNSAAILAAAAASVDPEGDENESYEAGDVQFQGLDVNTFLDVYALYSGRTVLRAYTLPAPAGVTLKAQTKLTRREVVEAMEGVLSLNGIAMIPIGQKFVKAVPSAQADKEGTAINIQDVSELPDSEAFITKIVQLKALKPSEIGPTLQSFSKSATAVTPIDSNQTLVLRDNVSNIKRMLELIKKIDVPAESDFQLSVIPIKYGKVTDIYATMSALIGGSGGGTATPGVVGAVGAQGVAGQLGGGANFRSRGSGSSRGGSYNRSGGGGYGGAGGGYNNYNSRSSFGGGGYYPQAVTATPAGTTAAGAQNSFQNRLNQIVNKASGAQKEETQILEGANIVPDERSNQLLVFANKRDMAMITNIVSKVDVLLSQVLIEAIILEVKLGDSFKLGVSGVQQPRDFGNGIQGGGGANNGPNMFGALTNISSVLPTDGGLTYLGKISGDFDFAISAIAKDNSINIVSRPRIQTSHAILGRFNIGETVPYVTGTTDYGGYMGNSGLSSRSMVTERPIGLTLEVTPFITPDGLVVMEIFQQFEQRGADVIIDKNPIPVVNNREAEATLTLRDKDMIMLGGFISENRSKSKSGVPFLKDIPGIGFLFRSTANSDDRTELIILLKATILKTPEAAAILATAERMNQPGTRKAIEDFEAANDKRQKAFDKSSKKKNAK